MSESLGERLRSAVAQTTSQPVRLALAAGEIVRGSRLAGLDNLVVTGGTAVVLATAVDFATRDIDLVTPDGDKLDAVLTNMGFVRRNDFQHIWKHDELEIYVQVAASFLPDDSGIDEVETPSGELVKIWSITDLVIDRLAQATLELADERLDQALMLLNRARRRFDPERAKQRATNDGLTRQLALLLNLYDQIEGTGDERTSDRAIADFWRAIHDLDLAT